MDWFTETFDKVFQNKIENNPEFKKKMDKMLDKEKKERFESIKEQICKNVHEEAYFEEHNSKVQNMINALNRLADNIENTPYLDHSESPVKRLWNLYQSFCERLQSLETDF